MNDDLISRQAVLALAKDVILENGAKHRCIDATLIHELPSAERKKGVWLEKHHAYADEENVIEEWQSCKCSICGRYETRPYLYYFNEPRFCSWCGAKMEGSDG